MAPAHSAIPRSSRGTFWLAFALVLAAVALSLSLACDHFQPGLDSDVLWPQVFAHDLGDARHPVSGWVFGAAPFWFPDFTLFLPLKWLGGDSGLNYPLFAVAVFLLIGATMVWSLAASGIERARAVIWGFLALDAVLLLQFLPGHGGWLWQLAIPGNHGAQLAVGFALLALALGAVRAGKWARSRFMISLVLMALGLASDNVLLAQWVGPLFLALLGQSLRSPGLRRVLNGFVLQTAAAIAFAVSLRIFLIKQEWFFFSSLLLYSPTPANIWRCFLHFGESFFADGMFAQNWLLWLLAAAAIGAAWRGLRKSGTGEVEPMQRFVLKFGLLSLLAAWALPIVTVYWVNPHSIRYLSNWVMLPAWLLAWRGATRPQFSANLPKLAGAVAAAGLVFGLPRISAGKLFFPQPDADLQTFCERHHFTQGLADYWHGHLLMAEWRFQGPRLGEIADEFFPVFWCNNAFDYFPPAATGPGLAQPAPQFIILDGLDSKHVMYWLQSNSLQVAKVGPYQVAVLTPEQSRLAGERLAAQAETLLKGRRADWLAAQLFPLH